MGYSENDDNRKSCHGRRIFCNNRKKRNNGCGHTFSIHGAEKIKRLRFSAKTLWAFFKLVIALKNTAQALRDSHAGFSISSAYRIWKRFVNRQSHIRTALAKICPPPRLTDSRQPATQTVAHVEAAFPKQTCPITAFQHQLQISFL